MKKILLTNLLFMAFAMLAIAQNRHDDEDDRRKESRAVADFRHIKCKIAANVVVTRADSFSFQVEGSGCIRSHIETKVVNETLTIRLAEKCHWSDPRSTRIYITMPNLENLDLNGAGEFALKGKWTGKKLDVYMNGAYNLQARDIEYDEVMVDLSGAGNARFGGKTTKANLIMSGLGNLDAYDLEAATVESVMSGMGNLECFASEEFVALMSGLGSINCIGSPKKVRKKVSGLGRVAAR